MTDNEKLYLFRYFLENDIKKMVEGLNSNQLTYLKLLYNEKYELLYKFFGADFEKASRKSKLNISQEEVNELYNLGYIDKRWIKSIDTFPDQPLLTTEGKQLVASIIGVDEPTLSEIKKELIASEKEKNRITEMFTEELFNAYPSTITVEEKNFMLGACKPLEYPGVTYQGKEDFGKLYCKIINYDATLHREIIKKIKNDKEKGNPICRVAITNFIVNKLWEHIKITTWNDIV